MASGLGRRFQEPGTPFQNKLLADFLGKPLLAYALDRTGGVPFAVRTAVTRSPEAAAYCRVRGVDTVLHALPFRSDTVRLGLERAEALSPRPLAGCLFCPVDQPLLRRESILALLASFAGDPEQIHRLCRREADGAVVPGTPVLFPRRLFAELKHLPEGRGGGYLAKKYPEQVTLVPVRDGYELFDVDTPADLSRLAAPAPGSG